MKINGTIFVLEEIRGCVKSNGRPRGKGWISESFDASSVNC